jgi:AraC-like DNA-binding protein
VGRARLAFAQGLSIWVLEAPDGFGDADFHAHHAIQITACLFDALTLESGETAMSGEAIAVAADARHRFAAHGLLAFIFVEPESRAGRALDAALFVDAPLAAIEPARIMPALASLRETFDTPLAPRDLLAAAQIALDAIVPTGPAPLTDMRVQKIVAHAARHPDLSLDASARDVGVHLSPSRLRHLFVEQTGLAFKTYMVWLRLVRALELYSAGQSLTEAAHEAGFSDSAHLSRIFRRTFGLPATTLTRL